MDFRVLCLNKEDAREDQHYALNCAVDDTALQLNTNGMHWQKQLRLACQYYFNWHNGALWIDRRRMNREVKCVPVTNT